MTLTLPGRYTILKIKRDEMWDAFFVLATRSGGRRCSASLTATTLSQVTHRHPRKRAAGSAALASKGCARTGRACRRRWRDCYAEKAPIDVVFYTKFLLNMDKHASGFFVLARRRPAGLLAASQGASTLPERKRHRRIVYIWRKFSISLRRVLFIWRGCG